MIGKGGRLAARPKSQNGCRVVFTDTNAPIQLRIWGLGTGSIEGAMGLPGGSTKTAQYSREPEVTGPVTSPPTSSRVPRPSLHSLMNDTRCGCLGHRDLCARCGQPKSRIVEVLGVCVGDDTTQGDRVARRSGGRGHVLLAPPARFERAT